MANRAQFYRDVPEGPFYGFNRPAKVSQGVIDNWWRQGSAGATVAAFGKDDYATALRLLRPLAEQGDADAQYNLGLMFADGRGVPQDYAATAS
jgi:hypothetical protein